MAQRKADVTALVEPRARRLADSLGFELVDVSLDRENTGAYLRIYIDKPEGITLNDCETYHRAIQPKVEDCDYDFLEVSSPGVDRPLKKDRDFERALGSEVEVHLFRPLDGSKQYQGILADFTKDELVLEIGGEERRFDRKAVALCRMVLDMTGVEDVDLSGPDEESPAEEAPGDMEGSLE